MKIKPDAKGSKRLQFLINKRAEHSMHALFKSGDYKSIDLIQELIPEINQIIISKLAEIDPTPNKKYAQWILREYSKGRFSLNSDSDQVLDLVQKFDKYQQVLKRKDIFQYSLRTLRKEMEFIDQMPREARLSNKAFNRWFKQHLKTSKQISVFYENQITGSKVIQLNSYQAGKFYSMNTAWCISQRGVFEDYSSRGDLFCIFYKKQKYLMHFFFEKENNLGVWSFEIASASYGNHCDIVHINDLEIHSNDIEFGAMVTEIMIWNALKKDVNLQHHENKPIFIDPGDELVNTLSRYLTIPKHRTKSIESSIPSLKGYIKLWSQQFSNYYAMQSIEFIPPLDELVKLPEKKYQFFEFYNVDQQAYDKLVKHNYFCVNLNDDFEEFLFRQKSMQRSYYPNLRN